MNGKADEFHIKSTRFLASVSSSSCSLPNIMHSCCQAEQPILWKMDQTSYYKTTSVLFCINSVNCPKVSMALCCHFIDFKTRYMQQDMVYMISLYQANCS